MHTEAFNWVKSRMDRLKDTWLQKANVLEIGSFNINGSIRSVFGTQRHGCYVGIDLQAGADVDLVIDASEPISKWAWVQKDVSWPANPRGAFEMVISMEALEHTPKGAEICENAFLSLDYGGVFLVTAAGEGRAPHSAFGVEPLRDGEYYQNVTRDHLKLWLSDFAYVEIEEAKLPWAPAESDIYAMAVKLW